MAFQIDPEQEALDRVIERERIAVAERQQEMMWKHEKDMLHLKLVEGSKQEVKLNRGRLVARVLLGLVKLPTLVILSIFVPIIVLSGREVPKFLQSYMNL
jgi:hypothetical protein